MLVSLRHWNDKQDWRLSWYFVWPSEFLRSASGVIPDKHTLPHTYARIQETFARRVYIPRYFISPNYFRQRCLSCDPSVFRTVCDNCIISHLGKPVVLLKASYRNVSKTCLSFRTNQKTMPTGCKRSYYLNVIVYYLGVTFFLLPTLLVRIVTITYPCDVAGP